MSLRYTNSRTERTCEKGSKSPSRVGSFGLSSIIGMLRPGGSGNGRTVFALPQPDGGRRWTEASGSGSRSGAERCAASQPVTARGSSGARAGRPGTAPPQPLGRSASGQGGGSGSPSAPLARGSPSGEAPKQQPPAQRQQVSPRANSNARRRPASAVPSATPRYMAALGSKARAREAKTSAPVHTHPAWAPDPRSAAPRAPAPSAITPAPETAPAAPEPEDVWRLHELSYRGMPLLHHRRTNLLYTSVPDDRWAALVLPFLARLGPSQASRQCATLSCRHPLYENSCCGCTLLDIHHHAPKAVVIWQANRLRYLVSTHGPRPLTKPSS